MGFFRSKNRIPGMAADSGAKHRILILTASNLTLQLIWFFYRMMLTRMAGSETLGLQSLVMQVYSLIVSIAISGLNVAVITQGAKIAGKRYEAFAVKKLFKNAVIIFICLYAAVILPVFVFRNGIAANLIGDPKTVPALIFVMLSIVMTGIENILKSIHISIGKVGKTAVSELTEQSLRFLIVFLLLNNTQENAPAGRTALIMAGMFMSEFFSVSFLLTSLKKICSGAKPDQDMPRVLEVTSGPLIKILIPAALTSFASTVFASAAALILPSRLIIAGYTRQTALSSIGILNAAAIPLVSLPMAFIGAVSTLLMPEISASTSKGETERVKRLLKKSYGAATLTLVLVNLPALFVFGRLAQTLFGVRPTLLCFALLTVKQGIIYMQVITSAALNGMMKQRAVLLFTCLGESVQLLLIFLMCADKNMHIYGYLSAMCIGEGMRLIISIIYISRRFGGAANSADAVCRREAAADRSR